MMNRRYLYGIETGIFKTIYARSGFLLDIAGSRYEWTVGAGLSLFNHFKCDYSVIISPVGFFSCIDGEGASAVRHGQWRLSFTYSGFGNWKNSDFRWWRSSD
ncbi:MAG: hypothetical protein GX640_03865 [Fibrobacter sp.]|nr:hypothetical protein [Fibrobacter sp.]